MELTPLEHLGEFGLIERLTGSIPTPSSNVIKGPGDDCAVLEFNATEYLLVSTDALMENVHFDLTYCPLKYLGYKAAAVNFSDVYAMNGRPFALTVTLALSARFGVEAVEELFSGILTACRDYGADLIGGDTVSSRTGMALSLTALGRVEKNAVVYRSGARPTDLICLTGDVGAACAGLRILEREKAVFQQNPQIQPDVAEFAYVVERQLRPRAKKQTLENVRRSGARITAMIDVSDGVANETWHLAKASGCGAVLVQDKLPIDYQTVKVSELFDESAVEWALYGGEDYELLFTVPVADYEKIVRVEDVSVVGYMTEKVSGVKLALSDGTFADLKFLGYNHFAT
ncbi:MAG: thiamine-phosphate kinase, partial [Bacteroidia bacterium]|nr:thiamine-phosphate kinase [Bacteroidia bacterium]